MKLKRAIIIFLFCVIAAASVSAQFSAALIEVTITTNVTGAQVTIGPRKGTTPYTVKLALGKYNITITKAGYKTYTGRFEVLRASRRIHFNLESEIQPVTVAIDANVPKTSVYLDDRLSGTTPLNLTVTPGRYNLRLEADGYETFETVLSVSPAARQSRSFRLQPMHALLNITIPEKYLNPDLKTPLKLIEIYVDDLLVNEDGKISQVPIEPGEHMVIIISGGLYVIIEENFLRGEEYDVELLMAIQVKKISE